ncbi:MAG: hypothetical protein IJ064_07420 [Bacteroidaceae bacterium]|nr:hypothetical protein [Bacteroidaceae bacterium]
MKKETGLAQSARIRAAHPVGDGGALPTRMSPPQGLRVRRWGRRRRTSGAPNGANASLAGLGVATTASRELSFFEKDHRQTSLTSGPTGALSLYAEMQKGIKGKQGPQNRENPLHPVLG